MRLRLGKRLRLDVELSEVHEGRGEALVLRASHLLEDRQSPRLELACHHRRVEVALDDRKAALRLTATSRCSGPRG